MSAQTSIQWTDKSWNPTRGCSRVSPGCGGPGKVGGCYAERMAHRFSGPGGPYEGLTRATKDGPRWTGKVVLVPEVLNEPLRWRKPQRIFVNSMSDLFHESLGEEQIANVFGVMAAAPRHTFQVLTKRPARMVEWFRWAGQNGAGGGIGGSRIAPVTATSAADWRGMRWPLPNVWLGVSVEDQATADERIPLLLQTPAAVRFVSLEPQLGPVDFERGGFTLLRPIKSPSGKEWPGLGWVIQGGESGPGARPFSVEWARTTRDQCKAAGVPYFLKQLGSMPTFNLRLVGWPEHVHFRQDTHATNIIGLRDRKGGDVSEWCPDLRVREFPRVAEARP